MGGQRRFSMFRGRRSSGAAFWVGTLFVESLRQNPSITRWNSRRHLLSCVF
jgi:hypothetical protein